MQPGLIVWMVLLLNFLGLFVELGRFIVLAASLFHVGWGITSHCCSRLFK